MVKFSLGQIVVTRTALKAITENDINSALLRHHNGDWGEVCEEDKQENEFSLENNLRIMSVYSSSNKKKFRIITEADRSSTTILLPEDY